MKRILYLCFVGIIFSANLIACSAPNKENSENISVVTSTPQKTADEIRAIDADACTKRGGQLQEVCMSRQPLCVIPYADAGKECQSSSECEGQCQTKDIEAHKREKTTGLCATNNDPCGCFASVEKGVAGRVICRD